MTTPAAGAWPSYRSYATRRPISRNNEPGSIEASDALTSRQLAVPVLLFDFGWTAARPKPVLQVLEGLDQFAHVRNGFAFANARHDKRIAPPR